MKPETKDPGQKFTPIWFGILGSLAVFLFILWLAVQPAPKEAGTRAAEFWSLPLNSMGDALAGLAASLAFLWLIVTAFIQKNELKEQRAALEAQRDELELARKVQGEQLKAMQTQAEIFRDEQRQRHEDRAETELNAELSNLVTMVREASKYDELVEEAFDFGRKHRRDPQRNLVLYTRYDEVTGPDEFIYMMYDAIADRILKIEEWNVVRSSKPVDLEPIGAIQDHLSHILEFSPRLSTAQKTRLETLRIEATAELIAEVFSMLSEDVETDAGTTETPQ